TKSGSRMSGKIILSFFALTLFMPKPQIPKFDVQGHRGARGLMPENSVPAFLLALDSGVTTLEMDLAITKDRQVIVSHEPWMSAAYCLDPFGKEIKARDEKKFNIFLMTYEEVKLWDCGSKGNPDFPEQKRLKTAKPLLADVIVAAENHIKNFTKYEVDYNIEIKSEPEGDRKFHPRPDEFSDLAFNLIDQYLPWDRVVIQSFDLRVLTYWHKKHPEVKLALLIDNLNTISENLTALGFVPDIYSPDYKLLDKNEVNTLHSRIPSREGKAGGKNGQLRVIPWTVNDEKEMSELKAMGVDGIITDYPDRARKLNLTLRPKN
ncbi:MAG TPA: glycerophosphodiester phosphodiesterase family protein, partial [Cyclobacteriaceae bacterium]|nr:glycerophosphodiester phosphodiesterase family protein [Cyclobacteriaceae bacterium]